MILMLRTDKLESELYLYNNGQKVDEIIWEAHRQLADTIHIKIKELLTNNKLDYKDITGIAVYKGPGSFTGLRIGITVANTLAYALRVPIVGVDGESWQNDATQKLANNQNDDVVLPNYGGEANITLPKK